MFVFYALILILLIVIFILLLSALKKDQIKPRFSHIGIILFTFFCAIFFWAYAGFASKSFYPLQTSLLAGQKQGDSRFSKMLPIIPDSRQEKKAQTVSAVAPVAQNTPKKMPDMQQMLSMADQLEEGLEAGTKPKSSWALLARTREYQGKIDKAAYALLKGAQAFGGAPEVQKQYQADINAFIERNQYSGQYLDALTNLKGK